MAKKSDFPSPEDRISATQASRSFSRILDEIESGRSFLVRRRGRDVCMMAPPPFAGRRASECLDYLRTRSPVILDDQFGKDLLEILAGEPIEERSLWGS